MQIEAAEWLVEVLVDFAGQVEDSIEPNKNKGNKF
jgi:hypothetical protein